MAKEKIASNAPILESDTLEVGCYYFSNMNELFFIKSIDRVQQKIHYINMSDQCHSFLALHRHSLVRKVR